MNDKMDKKAIYILLGSLKALVETGNSDEAIALIEDVLPLLDETKKLMKN